APEQRGADANSPLFRGKRLRLGRRRRHCVPREEPSPEWSEDAPDDRRAHLARKPEEERQVVEREQSMREELAGHEEVPEVRAREAAARVALALGVERRAVARVAGLFER